MKNDLIAVGIIFMTICFGLQSLEHNQELKRIHKLVQVERTAKIEAMKLAVEINNTLEIHREMNLSLNDEIDLLNSELKQYKALEKLKKDLDRSN